MCETETCVRRTGGHSHVHIKLLVGGRLNLGVWVTVHFRSQSRRSSTGGGLGEFESKEFNSQNSTTRIQRSEQTYT